MKLQPLVTISMDMDADHDVVFIHRARPDGSMALFQTLESPATVGYIWAKMM